MKLLIVDDEFQSCQLMAGKIRSFHFPEIEEVFCAKSGEEALHILEKQKIQLLITDICMSPMDGLELVAKGKEMIPELICVLVSAFDEFVYARRGIQLQIRDYWLKPCGTEQMRASLQEILEEYHSKCSKKQLFLNTIINEALLSGDRTLKEVFQDTKAYPGNGAYVAVWDGILNREVILPGFWVCMLPNGRSLFACPEAPENRRNENALKLLAERIGRVCGISSLGSHVAELYRQADLALSVSWVQNEKQVVFWQEVSADLDVRVSEARHKAMEVTSKNSEEILEWIEEKQSELNQFSAMVYIDRICHDLADEIAVLDGGQKNSGHILLDGHGWRRPLMILLKKLAEIKASQVEKRKKSPVQWSLEYINTHFEQNDLDLNMITGKLGLTHQYFSQLFHTQTGRTFSEYLLDCRMKEACRLLLHGETISEVAVKVGYQSPHSFARAFKRMFGIPPKSFQSGGKQEERS